MSTVLSELLYLPPIQAFAYYAKADHIVLEAHEHYQKGSYRNRCHIVGANGEQRLSIPLSKGKRSQMPIRDVELAFFEPWFKIHWKSIRSAYGNAPFFFYYSEVFEAIYQGELSTLWSFNLDLLKAIFELLQWDKSLTETDLYHKNVDTSITDIRGLITPNAKRKPTQSPNDSNNFSGDDILIKEYPQVFTERHGFTPNLSILDLLFCMGPQTNLYLQGLLPSK